MSSALSLTITDQTIKINGNLVKSGIRKLRQQEPKLTSGQQYELQIDEQASVDSAGLAYIANMLSLHAQTGGQITLQNIPSNMQQLIALAELDFIFEQTN